MNGLIIFGLIFLVITLIAGPKLTKVVLPGQCHQADEDVANNKKWYKIFLVVSIVMIVSGIIVALL